MATPLVSFSYPRQHRSVYNTVMSEKLHGRSVLVCVCGGIAAYKVCEVVSKLSQAGASVSVAMTTAAQHFVGTATFQALTANPVYTDLFATDIKDPQHIRLAREADLILVAPCTANMLAKMANGIADDLVSTLLLAAEPKKILLAPAMNEGMWNHPATQRNVKRALEDGVEMIGPATGWQACRAVGVGRMSEPADILTAIETKLAAPSRGNRI
ncbi:MAG: phosphopantothenoylcysteine decarboxylase [Phycisphaerales bacterium]|nr:phosphopantothenoylcysteine decarboxylase [Phycisphaerales bacterium]